jgi:hypothetical protein
MREVTTAVGGRTDCCALSAGWEEIQIWALSTLAKISVDFPASIVREGGLTACLTYLDFFPNLRVIARQDVE